MGLFDLFKRRSRTPARPGLPPTEFDCPRCPHYTFAHYALRLFAFHHPLNCMAILSSPESETFLADLLESAAEHCRERGETADFQASDLVVHRVRTGSFPCAIIEMPPPRAITEAFYAALVLLVDTELAKPDLTNASLRYFTLEKGFTEDGSSRTVLCEWTSEGSHVNYGDGPAPDWEAFAHAIARQLSK
jgi:hypothetical protein